MPRTPPDGRLIAAPVAQLDRVADFESDGWRFESSRARSRNASHPLAGRCFCPHSSRGFAHRPGESVPLFPRIASYPRPANASPHGHHQTNRQAAQGCHVPAHGPLLPRPEAAAFGPDYFLESLDNPSAWRDRWRAASEPSAPALASPPGRLERTFLVRSKHVRGQARRAVRRVGQARRGHPIQPEGVGV